MVFSFCLILTRGYSTILTTDQPTQNSFPSRNRAATTAQLRLPLEQPQRQGHPLVPPPLVRPVASLHGEPAEVAVGLALEGALERSLVLRKNRKAQIHSQVVLVWGTKVDWLLCKDTLERTAFLMLSSCATKIYPWRFCIVSQSTIFVG